jgi:ankyrin repeat protein
VWLKQDPDGYSTPLIYIFDCGMGPNVSQATPLACAVRCGHVGPVKLLLKAGADPNATTRPTSLPIRWAVEDGKPEILALLIEAGSAIDIELSVTSQSKEALKVLLASAGSDSSHLFHPKSELFENALLRAIGGNVGCFPVFLTAMEDANDSLFSGRTPLELAMLHSSADTVNAVVDLGGIITPHQLHARPEFTLHRAVEKSCMHSVRVLLERGDSIEDRDDDGWTPLTAAVCRGNSEVVQLLLERKADVEARDGKGYTPLLHAVSYNDRAKIVKQLLLAGADPAATDSNGYTPLSTAIQGAYVL